MSLSSLPTGTISDDGTGSRTYPPNSTNPGRTPAEIGRARRSADATPPRDVASIRRENEALRRANTQLRDKLDSATRDQQDVVDHYERLLAEFSRQDAVGTSPRGHTPRPRASTPSLSERVVATIRRRGVRLARRVAQSLGFQ
ncbi:hypothetical protein [Haloferax sp. DFSO52]|uniref:hypothetical protein n=1 Tax=Haloferax sp. DFSO52 TaxID=3388505 RepID=UPI003A88E6D7